MSGEVLLFCALAALFFGEILSLLRASSDALIAGLSLLFAAAVALLFAPVAPLAPLLVLVLGGVTLLARSPSWREPRELGRITESTLLIALAFSSRDLLYVGALWLLSFVPGLRFREQAGISRRPFAILAALSSLAVAGALAVHVAALDLDALVYLGCVVGAGIRMGVPPFSPLVASQYERLPFGRAAFVAAARPSVALMLAVRLAYGDEIAAHAGPLQAWAALAAIAAALEGLAASNPRRSIASMASTQASILLYGLVSPGETGAAGAMVQWAGLGLSLVGLGLLVEAIESRLGRRRGERASGLLESAPGMALLFLLFAATMSGFPGTAGFVGEDLVMQAETSRPLVWRPLLLAATAVNGATMLQMFSRSFLGPPLPQSAGFPPLGVRERIAVGTLALALVVITASPAVAVSGW